jgi:hypothetical protein
MKKKAKRLIPKTHCIKIFMWKDPDHKNLNKWSEYKAGMSAFSTGAASLTNAMEIVRSGLAREEYTHFVLSYPIAMQGITEGNPHSFFNRPLK